MPHIVLPRGLLVLFIIVLACFIAGGIAFIYLPAAKVIIHPAVSERSVEQLILLSTKTTEPDFIKFVLPARVVEKIIEEEKRVVREGAATTLDFAKGQVVLINNLDEEQQLLPKTHLRHEATGVFFLTDSPIAIPPGGKVSMNVTAKEKGEAGNVAAGRFIVDKLPAAIQGEVYAESSQAFTGGIAVDSPLTQEEISAVKEELLAGARERIRGELTGEAGGAAIRDDLLTVGAEEESVSAEAGSKTREFTVRVKVKARAFVVDENDLLSLTLLALRNAVSADEEFSEYRPDSFRVQIVRADFERGEAHIKGSITGLFAAKVGPTVLNPASLAGLSPEEVNARLSEEGKVKSVEVQLSPFWVQSVPARAGAVEMTIQQGQ